MKKIKRGIVALGLCETTRREWTLGDNVITELRESAPVVTEPRSELEKLYGVPPGTIEATPDGDFEKITNRYVAAHNRDLVMHETMPRPPGVAIR